LGGLFCLSTSLVLGEYHFISKNSEIALGTLGVLCSITGIAMLFKKKVLFEKIPADINEGIKSMFSSNSSSIKKYKKIEEDEEVRKQSFLINRKKEFGDYL
jgi:uncharacterized membrane protein YgaE (UPF0421/DUF939 family)